MNKNVKITACPGKGCIDENKLTFDVQMAVLLVLHEGGKLNWQQYNYAVQLLEKKYYRQ